VSAPTRADFDRVARAHTRATLGLVRLLASVQRDPQLRPISDNVFALLADQLAFAVEFERKMTEVAEYVAAWQYLCAENGRPPDRAVFEELLAEGEPEMLEQPVVGPALADKPTIALPIVEVEPSEMEEGWQPPSRELAEQLLRQRTATRSVWERDEPGGTEPPA
jgi:hypothetical protein